MTSNILLFCRRLIYDDKRGVGEVLNETVCVQNECEGLTVSITFQLIFLSTVVEQGSLLPPSQWYHETVYVHNILPPSSFL